MPQIDTTKRCPGCKEDKPLKEFGPRRDGKRQSWCRSCHAKLVARRRQQTGMRYERAYKRALRAATAALIDAHPDEFEALMAVAREREGI